jgi:pre-mRNA-processing factor 19
MQSLMGAEGNIFEKRLIEAYIADHGSDPVNGEELSVDDLVELKNARAVRPRPPTLTSIPALLSTFQNEWDALALESYTLKQQLAQTRQELSTALYDFEGALRVIAKLTQERDEARDALSKVTVQGGAAGPNGDAMQVDGQELPEAVVERIDATQQKYLSFCSTYFSVLTSIPAYLPHDENVPCQPTGQRVRRSPHLKAPN